MQSGDVVCHTAQLRSFPGLCLKPVRSPPQRFPYAPRRLHGRAFWQGSPAEETSSRPGLRSSSHYPLGNCVGWRFETSRQPDSTRARFLIAARRTVPGSCRRPVMTPAGGTGDICLPLPVLSGLVGSAAPVATFLSPVTRDYPSRILDESLEPPQLRQIGRAHV